MKSAREISTFKGGGSAYVFMPENVEKLIKITHILREENLPFSLLGNGSNTLISDGFCKSILISTRRLDGVRVQGTRVVCGAGASMARVAKEGRKHAIVGLEFLSGVPCSVGGAIKMNAGAFGAQTADYIDKIGILTADFDNNKSIVLKEIDASDCDFAYRKGVDDIVAYVILNLKRGDLQNAEEEAKRNLLLRREKQPSLPSLGSVFKNGEAPSGKLIEKCALKGVRKGGAKISEKHANFIVNIGGATASDYLYLVDECKQRVYKEFGIQLQEEFVLIK